ncbi:hypothetical protein KVR01_012536 [Diaporthe batatas]|uniref:uncharacterized protein n=1 Tax=Diaporthe batatas TaxID=748121 RepID=UPI001D03DBF2|nr:uncharacterized protein KVR01_012536 [Diaporthe batatas]KAG8157494.1 hypothetical protein KVR01_012536 [Diaporthe batatas]
MRDASAKPGIRSHTTFAGRAANVTGYNAGLGVAIAQELSCRGASVVANHPSPALADDAQRVVSGLLTVPTSIAVEADLSTEGGPRRLIDAAVARYKTVHVLVNNSGLAVNKPTLRNWKKLVGLNARTVFSLVQAVLSHLPDPSHSTQEHPQSDGGHILSIVSISSRAIYAGPNGMVDNLTKELPPRYDCTVNAMCLGSTMTAGFAAAGQEFMKDTAPVKAQTPMGHRLARLEETASGVGLICEPRAGSINGLI